jgi:hypothetical protein
MMNQNHQGNVLTAEDREAVARFILKRPDIYQRWQARRQTATAKLAAVLQGPPRNQSASPNKKPGA